MEPFRDNSFNTIERCAHGVEKGLACAACRPPTIVQASVLPKVANTVPQCRGCRFTVEKHGDVCAECAMKPQFQPPPLRPIAPQPQPPYLTEGNFRHRDTPESDA